MPSTRENATVVPATAQPQFGVRLLVGVLGVLLAAIMSGVNNRVGSLALLDVQASLGAGADDGSWLSVMYSAGELAAMPFSAWFAVTFSLRRYHIAVVALFCCLGLLMPSAQSLSWLITLRGIQGFFGGLLIPVLMAAALRFFPTGLRLYGLSLYALTATFSPNVAGWLTGVWTDTFADVHLIYLQNIPLGVLSIAAVAWGIPQDPVRLDRLRQINWAGLATGSLGLVLVAVGLGQGQRFDWLNSPLIQAALFSGVALVCVFLTTEWFHPLPFVRLQLLRRRNLGLGFIIFTCMLVVFLSGSLLPAEHLIEAWHFRAGHLAPVSLLVGLPQLIVGPAVSLLLYQQRIDARKVFAAGLGLMALSCLMGSRLTSEWMARDFFPLEALQAFGQPMAVIGLLFLATSVVQPQEGPAVSGIINTLRAFGTLMGQALVQHLVVEREKFHSNVLTDRAGAMISGGRHSLATQPPALEALTQLSEHIRREASVLAIADGYVVLGALAATLIPLALSLQYISPPKLKS